MLINLSTNGIDIYHENQVYQTPKLDVVDNFHIQATEILTKNNPDTMYVLSGPGSFTTLRAGALVINTLITNGYITPQIFSCHKIDFFQTLVKKQKLPSLGYIRIGQKKNVWKYNFTTQKKIQLPISEINEQEEYFTETIPSPHQISITSKQTENLSFSYQNQTFQQPINTFPRKKSKLITPDYLIQAV